MKIKETPTNFRVYYTQLKAAYTQKRKDADDAFNALFDTEVELYNSIKSKQVNYLTNYNLDLAKYKEFTTNTYINGEFLRVVKSAFINKKNDCVIISDLFDLLRLAKMQANLKELENELNLCSKILNLSIKEYSNILKTYYEEVQRHLILQGEGYVFESPIGWTCIGRCKIDKQKPMVNFAATKKRKEELKQKDIRLYNREEAEWCKKNGIEYKAEDPRVYLHNEYCYEMPLIDCKLPNGRKYKLTTSDYRGLAVRGKSNKDLLEETGGDKYKICELPVDIRTKLNLCLEADKMLYLNFIRNENQKPLNAPKARRKN